MFAEKKRFEIAIACRAVVRSKELKVLTLNAFSL